MPCDAKWDGIKKLKFFSEKEGKRKEKIGKSVRNLPKTGQKLVKIQNFVLFAFFLIFSQFLLIIFGMGRKWEGNFVYSWYVKEMGRKLCVLCVWE